MRRFCFYILRYVAFLFRALYPKMYMKLMIKAHTYTGVVFNGNPEYIDFDAHLDPSGGLTIGEGAVIGAGSTVTKDVRPNTIVAGNPAKIIKEINPCE